MPKTQRQPGGQRRKWAFRFAAILLLLLVPVLAEGGLRLFGYGYPTSFVIREGEFWFPNEKFARQFFGGQNTSRPVYFRVPVREDSRSSSLQSSSLQRKPVRIVVLGESAAMGTPDPAFSFGRTLEVILEHRFPGMKFELVNAAMRGIDSHVVRRIAQDCARLQPDLFIVYMGNNEVIGLHGPEPGCSRVSQSLRLMRAGQFLKSTRLGQVFRKMARGDARPPSRKQDMEFFRKHRLRADDWRRETVRKNFAANLEHICRTGTAGGAHVVVSTVPVNMKDFPPLGSLPPNEQNAEAQFRLGQYQRALDYDALQFRADSRLNQRIREVAARFPTGQVTLVDAVKTFAEADGGIPGATLFRDHVHPTFEGDYLLARTLLPAIEKQLVGRGVPAEPHSPLPTREECAKLLAYTDWHDAQIQLAMADLTSRPPYHDQLDYRERQSQAEKAARERLARLGAPEVEAAVQISLAAVKRRPDDWMLHHNCAQLYQAVGRPAAAIGHLEQIARTFPHSSAFQMLLGQAFAASGRIDAAIFHFEQAIKLDPDDARAREGLAQLRKHARGK